MVFSPVNPDLLQNASHSAKWTEKQKLMDSVRGCSGGNGMLRNIFHTKRVSVVEMSALCFIDIFISSSDSSFILLF